MKALLAALLKPWRYHEIEVLGIVVACESLHSFAD